MRIQRELGLTLAVYVPPRLRIHANMPLQFEPWRAPAEANLDFLGRSSTVNPGGGSAPSFHGQTAKTELGVHGNFDSPEDTAQTSPATITVSVPVKGAKWDATIADLRTLQQKVVLVSITSDGGVTFVEPLSTTHAYANDYDFTSNGGNHELFLHAIALTSSPAGDDTVLATLLPTSAETNKTLSAMTYTIESPSHICNVGVLVSHIAEKSAGKIHITLAVEHAVEIKLNKKFGTAVIGDLMGDTILAAEPLLFKWDGSP